MPPEEIQSNFAEPQVAVLIPCRDEAAAIAGVIRDFRTALPNAEIYVYDNKSSDNTAEIATKCGVIVRHEKHAGKGNVVRRMFSDVEADVYVLVDGDDTYDASAASAMVAILEQDCLDMIVAARTASSGSAYRAGHQLGNLVLTRLVAVLFGNQITDMLSGYRVFSRRFVKSFPALSTGFEIETELTVHALELRMPIDEVTCHYRARPTDSNSKLNTYRDGWRILKTIIKMAKEEKPLLVFGFLSLILASSSLLLAWPLLGTYLETGEVPRFPTAILATSLIMLASLSLVCGAILDTVTLGRRETKRLAYLNVVRYAAERLKNTSSIVDQTAKNAQ